MRRSQSSRSAGTSPTWSPAPARIRSSALLDDALERAGAFAERYRGALATIDGASLVAAMNELAAIYDLVGRAELLRVARLRDRHDRPRARRSGGATSKERSTALATTLLFFDLEWAALSDERVDELLAHDGLDFCRHHLRTARRYRPHLLSEPEELILTEKTISGSSAWTRLFGELTSSIEVELDDHGDAGRGARRGSPRPRARCAARPPPRSRARCEPGLRTRAFIFNTLLVDKATDDRLRHYDHWLAARNLANEASDESVEALVARRHGPLRAGAPLVPAEGEAARHRPPRRLRPHARRSPPTSCLSSGRPRASWCSTPTARSRRRSARSPSASSPSAGSTPRPRHGKQGGGVLRLHRAVRASLRAAQLHRTPPRRAGARARAGSRRSRRARRASRGSSISATPLTLAETASVFGEALTFGRLLEASPTRRRASRCSPRTSRARSRRSSARSR